MIQTIWYVSGGCQLLSKSQKTMALTSQKEQTIRTDATNDIRPDGIIAPREKSQVEERNQLGPAWRIQSSKCIKEKSFPLDEALGVLYEGHIAQGRHCLTSRKPPTITKSSSNFGAKEKMVASTSKRNTRDRSDDSMRTPSIIDINDIPAWDDADGDVERENTVSDEEEFGSEDADGDHPQISESSAKGRKPKK
ncbi:hypothetical protein D1007_20593 [Hordeum vulgare]|nr:hypothetical protein D1007_20593 [Hordeum vulgare]